MKNKRNILLIRTVLFVSSFAMCCTMRTVGDDYIFKDSIFRYGGFLQWLLFYSENWSGRVIPHGILVLLLQLPHSFFVVINSVFMCMLPIQLIETFMPATSKKGILALLLWILILFQSTRDCFANATLWKCASVLYLWGQNAFILAIRPLLTFHRDGSEPSIKMKILAVIGGIYASSFEQIAACMFAFFLILCIWDIFVLKRVNRFNVFLSILVCFLSVFFVKMPGNSVRTAAEAIRWMPDFPMLTMWDKLFNGVIFCLKFISKDCPLVMALLSASLFVYIIKTNPSRIMLLISVLTVFYYGLNLICWFTENRTYTDFYFLSQCFSFVEIGASSFSIDVKHLLMSFIGFMALMSVTAQLFLVCIEKDRNCDIIKPLLFLGGCGMVCLMAFSPTIVASGDRVLFPAVTFLSTVLIITVTEVLQSFSPITVSELTP